MPSYGMRRPGPFSPRSEFGYSRTHLGAAAPEPILKNGTLPRSGSNYPPTNRAAFRRQNSDGYYGYGGSGFDSIEHTTDGITSPLLRGRNGSVPTGNGSAVKANGNAIRAAGDTNGGTAASQAGAGEKKRSLPRSASQNVIKEQAHTTV